MIKTVDKNARLGMIKANVASLENRRAKLDKGKFFSAGDEPCSEFTGVGGVKIRVWKAADPFKAAAYTMRIGQLRQDDNKEVFLSDVIDTENIKSLQKTLKKADSWIHRDKNRRDQWQR